MGGSGIPPTWPNPWKILGAKTDIRIRYVDDLPPGMAGYWSPRHRMILLRDDLTMVERRWALMHELGHIDNDHWWNAEDDDDLLAGALEEEADQWAARKILPIRLLGPAARLHIRRAVDVLYLPAQAIRVRMQHLHPSERHLLRRAHARNREDQG